MRAKKKPSYPPETLSWNSPPEVTVPGRKWPGDGCKTRVGVAPKERRHLIRALGLEHRAGAVHQPAARLEQGPQGFEQLALDGHELFHVGGSAKPSARPGGGARCPKRCRGHRAGWHRKPGRPTRRGSGPHRRTAPRRSGPGGAGCRGCARSAWGPRRGRADRVRHAPAGAPFCRRGRHRRRAHGRQRSRRAHRAARRPPSARQRPEPSSGRGRNRAGGPPAAARPAPGHRPPPGWRPDRRLAKPACMPRARHGGD